MLDEFHLNYLADFRKFRNKNVAQAAKSIVNLYRELNPKLLKKDHRGRQINIIDEDQMENKILAYGEVKLQKGIPGIDLLKKRKANQLPLDATEILSNSDLKKIKYLKYQQDLMQIARKKMRIRQEDQINMLDKYNQGEVEEVEEISEDIEEIEDDIQFSSDIDSDEVKDQNPHNFVYESDINTFKKTRK